MSDRVYDSINLTFLYDIKVNTFGWIGDKFTNFAILRNFEFFRETTLIWIHQKMHFSQMFTTASDFGDFSVIIFLVIMHPKIRQYQILKKFIVYLHYIYICISWSNLLSVSCCYYSFFLWWCCSVADTTCKVFNKTAVEISDKKRTCKPARSLEQTEF